MRAAVLLRMQRKDARQLKEKKMATKTVKCSACGQRVPCDDYYDDGQYCVKCANLPEDWGQGGTLTEQRAGSDKLAQIFADHEREG